MLAVGLDLVEVERIEALLMRWGPERLGRLFTPAEIRYALSSPRLTAHRLAARFAAKEAFRKAAGWAVPFRELEVTLEGSRPWLVWKNRRYPVSLTHTARYAGAVVAAEVTPFPPRPGASAAPEG